MASVWRQQKLVLITAICTLFQQLGVNLIWIETKLVTYIVQICSCVNLAGLFTLQVILLDICNRLSSTFNACRNLCAIEDTLFCYKLNISYSKNKIKIPHVLITLLRICFLRNNSFILYELTCQTKLPHQQQPFSTYPTNLLTQKAEVIKAQECHFYPMHWHYTS